MPPYGTQEFKRTQATIYIRKDFLNQMPCEIVVFAIEHEMAHVVLNATGNLLRDNEKAVDLSAMLLGFSEIV
jgi:hypothetical protein